MIIIMIITKKKVTRQSVWTRPPEMDASSSSSSTSAPAATPAATPAPASAPAEASKPLPTSGNGWKEYSAPDGIHLYNCVCVSLCVCVWMCTYKYVCILSLSLSLSHTHTHTHTCNIQGASTTTTQQPKWRNGLGRLRWMCRQQKKNVNIIFAMCRQKKN